jgi:DNA repair protein RadC
MKGLDPIAAQLLQTLGSGPKEAITFVFLDAAGATLGVHHAPAARVASVDVPIRPMVATALVLDASLVLMAHNHPSGDPEPTAEDIRTTRRVADILDGLGIRLVDHLVLAGDAAVSFRARGLL